MSHSSIQEAAIGASYISNPTNDGVVFGRKSTISTANLRMPLLLFSDDDADTFVYIESAPQQIDEARYNESHRRSPPLQREAQVIPHRVHSRKLLSTGSDVLKDLFQPRKQARVRKRYGLTHQMPPGVKYAIDLTPPSEGDEAVIFMTELSCPMGVRRWFELLSPWKLPVNCVGGQDEVEWLPLPGLQTKMGPTSGDASGDGASQEKEPKDIARRSGMEEKQSERQPSPPPPPKILNWQGNLPTLRADLRNQTPLDTGEQTHTSADSPVQKEPEVPNASRRVPGLPLDYSPTRHRTCLERILYALEGLNPELDTAPKLWTFFALAKLLQIATHPEIGDHILVWLYQGNNSLFVEVNPELSYRIACGLQNRVLCQDSFAILVGEEALSVLDSLVRGTVPKYRTRTIHGRNREPLDDTEMQRVEYASKVFLDRVLDEFIKLAGTEMLWVERIVMKNIQGSLRMPAHERFVNELTDFCKRYVRSQVYDYLNQNYAPSTGFRFQLISGTEYPGLDFYTAQSRMPVFCRILTPTFWKHLGDVPAVTAAYVPEHSSLRELAPALPNLQDQKTAVIQHLSPSSVDEAISSFLSGVNEGPHRDSRSDVFFDFTYFQNDVTVYLKSLSTSMTNPPNSSESTTRTLGVQFELIDTLVCLGEKEFKFLPLWAGGNDDGTGGVFDDDQGVPLVKDDGSGFSTAGPSVRLDRNKNNTDDYDTFSTGSFDAIHPDDAASTIERASHEATASHATTASVVSRFDLVQPFQDMDIGGTTKDDFDIEITGDDRRSDDDDFEFFDDDDDDTIGMISDNEDM